LHIGQKHHPIRSSPPPVLVYGRDKRRRLSRLFCSNASPPRERQYQKWRVANARNYTPNNECK
jgi:hypothetical protein